MSPHNVVNHSSHKEATIHRSSNHTWSSVSPLMSALTTHMICNQREKKRKETTKRKTTTSDRKPKKGKEQDHLKKNKSRTLRQGQRLDTSETKPCSNKERKPPNQRSNTTKSSPCTYATMQHGNAAKSKNCSTCPGRLDLLHRAVRPPAPDLTAWGRLDRPKRPTHTKLLKNFPNQLEHLPNTPRCPKHAQTSPPCWQCMNQGKMRKVSAYSFSNIQNSSQGATQVQMSKLDTLQVRNDLNYMITKLHNHWTRLKGIWVILRKVTLS
jgi:hypothetical protein